MNQESTNENEKTDNSTNNFEEVPIYQEVETKKKEVRTDSYFDGGVLELIGWRILALLITVVTLGIANPWAQCMLYSWQIKHTVYNGKRLKFEGTGGDLFVNMFKWLFFTIITLGIYALFIPIRKAKWVVSNIHYEDEEFVKDDSFFDGNTLQLIGINILYSIITLFSLGLLYPFAVCLKLKWINKHSVINRKKLVFDGNGLQLWGKYLLWWFLTIITFGIFSIWLPILMLKWETKHIHIKTVGEEEKKDKTALIIIPIVIVIMILVIAIICNVISKIPEDKWTEITHNSERLFKKNSDTVEMVREDEYSALVPTKEIQSAKSETKTTIPESTTVPTPTPTPTPIKTSITVGGYTLNFGTYTGTIVQGVWDEETMTASSKSQKVTLKLSENSITLDGKTAGYTISGTTIKWKALDFDVLQVTGNNRITYLAENCPELVWQGK